MLSIENRVLVMAVMVSLLWHTLCLSVIKVVVKPGASVPVKFSKVAFLGPAAGISPGEIKVEPRSSSFLENRYRNNVMKMAVREITLSAGGTDMFSAKTARMPSFKEGPIKYLIQDALEGTKSEAHIMAE